MKDLNWVRFGSDRMSNNSRRVQVRIIRFKYSTRELTTSHLKDSESGAPREHDACDLYASWRTYSCLCKMIIEISVFIDLFFLCREPFILCTKSLILCTTALL